MGYKPRRKKHRSNWRAIAPAAVVSGVTSIKRKCSNCGAKTTIDGMKYCWQCRAKLPTGTPKTQPITRAISQGAAWLAGLAAVAGTIWWALQ